MAGESARAVASGDRAKAERLLKRAERFEQGADGEEATAEVLGELSSSGWRVFHDVQWPGRERANIDHVLVGPPGVFVVDTKAWSGRIEVGPGSLRVAGQRRTRTLAAAKEAATAVSGLLPRLHPSAVHPVVCFVRPEPLHQTPDEVLVCSTQNVAALLADRPVLLDEPQVSAAAEVLGRSLKAAPARLPLTAPHRPGKRIVDETILAPVEPTRREARRASTTRRRRRRQRVTGPRVAALFIVAFAGLFFGAGGFERVTDLGAQALGLWRTPTAPIGKSITVEAGDARPELVVQARPPLVTRSATPGARVAPGHVLQVVRISLRNTGEATWVSQSSLAVRVYDAAEAGYRPAPGITRTALGTVMPAVVSLPPGRTKRFRVAFDVPRGVRLATVELAVGSGTPTRVRWAL